MIPLGRAVEDYLAMRRALGYKLTEHGRVLPQFARFLDERGEPLITVSYTHLTLPTTERV